MNHLFLAIACAELVMLALACWQYQRFNQAWRWIESRLNTIGRKRGLAIILVMVLAFAIQAGIGGLLGICPPHIHDEFANLLAADTFAHGRLSNPPHKLWEFFEGIHILSQPAYVSKYPPAQGIMLAMGQVLFQQPIIGEWISVALACGAICWALMAWTPGRWALLGGILAAFHPIVLKWGQVYWGGTEAMLGGALLVGAVRRLADGIKARDSVWLAVGLGILANSRPFEGLVLSAIFGIALLVHFMQKRMLTNADAVLRLAMPVAIVMGGVIALMGYYNLKITGNALKMPYMVCEEQYAMSPFLVWQKSRPEPQYRHPFIRDHFAGYGMEEYERQQTAKGFINESISKFKRLAQAGLWNYLLIIPLLTLPWMIRRKGWVRIALIAFVLFLAALLMETWMWDRYAAPIGAVFLLLVILGFRHLCLWQWGRRPIGRIVVVLVLLACLLQSLLWVKVRRWEYSRQDWDWQRAAMIKKLQREGGRHLIVVRYGPKQSVHNDWVHNDADIDASQIAWARDMGEEKHRRLLDYFKDRKIWLLETENPWEPDAKDIQKAELKPYPVAPGQKTNVGY